MLYGYADESGEPGLAKSDHDYFVFCIVLFDNRNNLLKCSELVDKFRFESGFSDTHEFHYSTDSKKTRPQFTKLISAMDFRFISVSIRKKSTKIFCSYEKIADAVLSLLDMYEINANISMDVNPLLYTQFRKQKNYHSVVLHFSEKQSRGNNLIQIADYVTALVARHIKYPGKNSAQILYKQIEAKHLSSLNIS